MVSMHGRSTFPRLRLIVPVALVAAVFALPLVLGACNSGELTLTEADADAVPQFPSYDQVAAIVERNCVPCHKTGDCLGADDDGFDPNYSDCDCLRRGFGLLLQVVDAETMPPGAWPRLTDAEKQILHNWWDAGGCSPCSEDCPE